MVLFWFRRDLRIEDNAALYDALKNNDAVQCIFIFDTNILKRLTAKNDARLSFIYEEVKRLSRQLEAFDASLLVFNDTPLAVFKQLLATHKIEKVYANEDYEPEAQKRDEAVRKLLLEKQVDFVLKKDQVIFHPAEILKSDNTAYTVYTPYMKKWREHLSDFYLKAYPSKKYSSQFSKAVPSAVPSLKSIGFDAADVSFPDRKPQLSIIKNYDKNRDYPALEGSTRIGLHLRFGTVSIRKMVQLGIKHSEKWLNELIWREFYQMLLFHFPHTVTKAFKPAYDRIHWSTDEKHFKAWCEGKTGYPLVDAGMRQLNETGFMHNRVRMITASFLTKHLLIDWRWGEAYFAQKLLDYELASNIGNWQWVAGTGSDPVPYFRIFNPMSQAEKFDPEHHYIRKWVPEYNDPQRYPKPIVDHKTARERAIQVFKNVVKE